MVKKTVKYVDYNGVERSEDLYFNLTQLQATELALELPEDINDEINSANSGADVNDAAAKIMEKLGNKGIMNFIKLLVLRSYGKRGEDGKSFIKSEELSTEFSHTIAFSNLMMELISDDKAASEFINGVIPSGLNTKTQNVTPTNVTNIAAR